MTHRGPFQPLPFCDSVILCLCPRAPKITNFVVVTLVRRMNRRPPLLVMPRAGDVLALPAGRVTLRLKVSLVRRWPVCVCAWVRMFSDLCSGECSEGCNASAFEVWSYQAGSREELSYLLLNVLRRASRKTVPTMRTRNRVKKNIRSQKSKCCPVSQRLLSCVVSPGAGLLGEVGDECWEVPRGCGACRAGRDRRSMAQAKRNAV